MTVQDKLPTEAQSNPIIQNTNVFDSWERCRVMKRTWFSVEFRNRDSPYFLRTHRVECIPIHCRSCALTLSRVFFANLEQLVSVWSINYIIMSCDVIHLFWSAEPSLTFRLTTHIWREGCCIIGYHRVLTVCVLWVSLKNSLSERTSTAGGDVTNFWRVKRFWASWRSLTTQWKCRAGPDAPDAFRTSSKPSSVLLTREVPEVISADCVKLERNL